MKTPICIDSMPHYLFDPYDLSKKDLEKLRKMAREIMERQKCTYTQAVIIAYCEWVEMGFLENTTH